ncbi:MAG: HhH-GPD-type base excision DNA repair protein [Acetobacteraceae bacterium]
MATIPRAEAIATADPGVFAKLFATPPAIHRFPAAMAERAQALAGAIVTRYGGDAAALWNTAPSARDLLDRLKALPGFGPQKAKIFIALLAKQRDVRLRGWREAAEPYSADGGYQSVADVTDAESLHKVRERKKAVKAARG